MQTSTDFIKTEPLYGEFYNYYFIGNGAQFRVYAIYTLDGRSTGRVIKVPLSFTETKQNIIEPLRLLNKHRSEDHLDVLADERAREVMQFKNDLPNLVQGAYGQDRLFSSKLGNLKVLQTPIPANTGTSQAAYYLPIFFTQDYVVTLDDYLQNFRLATISYTRELDIESIKLLKQVINQMIALNYTIWEYGIFEFVFKPENLGIRPRANGSVELIWMDLAEHITDIEQAAAIMHEKRWLHPLMAHKVDYQFMPTVLHEHYTKVLNEAFSEESLRKHWRRKCIRIEERAAKKLVVKEFLSRSDKQSVGFWVARHNLSKSLYRGFPDTGIDDMGIPVEDLQMLLQDKHRENLYQSRYVQERIERKQSGYSNDKLLFPSTSSIKKAGI
jgi:hypothetical protein